MNTKTARHSLDMLHGSLIKKILLFALPIAASSILQQLFNSADTAVAGQFGNADALAPLVQTGEIVALIVGICVGIAVGANVLIAKFIGAGERHRISGRSSYCDGFLCRLRNSVYHSRSIYSPSATGTDPHARGHHDISNH